MRLTVLLLCAGLATPAPAETIYRCKSASGKVSLQSAPCRAGERTQVKQYQRPAYSADAATRLKRIEAAQALERRAEVAYGNARQTGPRGPTESQRKAAACADARQRRDATLKIVGMRRNFDLLRALDADVHSACR